MISLHSPSHIQVLIAASVMVKIKLCLEFLCALSEYNVYFTEQILNSKSHVINPACCNIHWLFAPQTFSRMTVKQFRITVRKQPIENNANRRSSDLCLQKYEFGNIDENIRN